MNTQSQQDLSCAQLAEDPTTQAAAVSPSITVAHAAVVDPPVDEQTSTESEMPLAPAGRFYAVIRGRNPGIYDTQYVTSPPIPPYIAYIAQRSVPA